MTVEEFSAGYFIVDADIVEYTGESVAAAEDFVRELEEYAPVPLLKIGSAHYWPEEQHAIPSETIAVPEGAAATRNESVLLAKHPGVMREEVNL
jgi:hypothetical protein